MSKLNKVTEIDLGWDDILKELEKIAREGKTVVAGFIEGQGGDSVHSDTNLTNAELASIHEFGSPSSNLPARPFMRQGTEKAKDEVNKAIISKAKDMFGKKGKGTDILEAVGNLYVDAIKSEITSGAIEPTKEGKRALFNTKELYDNITFKVKKDK